MKHGTMDQIPLAEALLCVNCSTICRRPKQYCPGCAGEQLMALAVWLGPRALSVPSIAAGRRSHREGGEHGAQV
jgi:hypothetical protein